MKVVVPGKAASSQQLQEKPSEPSDPFHWFLPEFHPTCWTWRRSCFQRLKVLLSLDGGGRLLSAGPGSSPSSWVSQPLRGEPGLGLTFRSGSCHVTCWFCCGTRRSNSSLPAWRRQAVPSPSHFCPSLDRRRRKAASLTDVLVLLLHWSVLIHNKPAAGMRD